MDMHDVTTTKQAEQAQPDITVHDAMATMTHLLDIACGEFMDAQQAVDECVRDHPVTDDEMRCLQKLDVATQTVAAVARVLRNLSALSPAATGQTVDLTRLHDGVTLGTVVRALKGSHAPDPETVPPGTMDLF